MAEQVIDGLDAEQGMQEPAVAYVGLGRLDQPLARARIGLSRWLCETRGREVAFAPEASSQLYAFALDAFLVDGRLPSPVA